jgi:hypothetical protein
MLSKRVVSVVAALCCLFALTPSALFSQSATTGAVTGIVTDPTGSVVPGAAITLTQLGTNVTQTTTTDSSGRYLLPAASPGQYSLKCTGKGFRTTTISRVQIEVLRSSTLDIKLELGAQSETIEVVAATGAELQTTDASIGTTFSGEALLRLPAQQRSITAILLMQPGVSPAMPAQNKDDINGGQVAGALPDQTTFFVDGGDATSDLEGTNNYVSPPGEPQPAPFIAVPAETVQEFRLVTASPTANFSRSQGGEVAVLTKSGSNSVHGSAYEYYYGDATSGNDWQLNSLGRHKPHSVNNRFGTSVGAPLLKNKLFIFGNYEGRRFHQATTITQLVPTDSARQGKIILQDTTGAFQTYSLTPGSVSSNCGASGTSTCDPRNGAGGQPMGMDPLIQAYFKLLPEPNNFSAGDGTKFKAMFPTGLNSAGFTTSFAQPVREDIAVARLDYVINPKWNIFGTYHYNRYRLTTTNQFDITASGTPHLASTTPVEPRLVTFMLQGTVGSHFTSQTHGSYMRDWWAWGRQALAPQVPGTAGTLNLSGEARLAGTASTSKVWGDPTNFDTQDARSRIWFGRDYYAAQDSTWVHGTHTIQFGGGYWFWNLAHSRTDIVTGGLTGGPTYYVGETQFNGGNFLSAGAQVPANLSSTNGKRFSNMYTSLLGLMDHSAQIGVRDGNFNASPLGSGLKDNVHTHTFETYIQDSWKIRRSLTITYGLSYGVQFAPHELNGKQVLEVFAGTGQPLSDLNAFYQLRNAALSNGQFYASGLTSSTDTTFGFSPIRHIPGRSSSAATHWNNLGPRVAVAWQPGFNNRIFGNKQTVIRAGYSILWNRTSGVQEALTPLLGDGLASKLQCNGPTFAIGSTTATCSNAKIDATNGFRLGVDGNTAPIPPALNSPIPLIPNSPFNGGVNVQDPGLKLPYSHNVTLDIQRAFAHNMLLDVGYIGRFAKNLWYNSDVQSADMFAKTPACTAGSTGCNVPTTGQTLWQAYNAVNAGNTAAQPFFENAPFGCAGCTAKIIKADAGDVSLSNFMLNNWDFIAPRPLDPLQLSNNNMTTSGETANYNAMFVTFRKTMSQGLDMSVNYTWSHALGNGGQNFIGQEYTSFAPPTPFDLNSQYASNNGDRRHVINASAYYLLPFGKGRHFTTSNGILDRVIGGWYVSGIWTYETGLPFCVGAGGGDYGAPNGFTCAIGTPLYGKASLHHVAGSGTTGLNLFADAAGAIAGLRAPLPGVDGRPGGEILNLPHSWNFDFAAGKNILATERYKVVFSAEAFNTFNHPLFGTTPNSVPMDITVPGNFGVISKADNLARQVQFGLRVEF